MAGTVLASAITGWSANAPDGNVRFVERHAVEVARLSERIGEFTAAARSALDDVGD